MSCFRTACFHMNPQFKLEKRLILNERTVIKSILFPLIGPPHLWADLTTMRRWKFVGACACVDSCVDSCFGSCCVSWSCPTDRCWKLCFLLDLVIVSSVSLLRLFLLCGLAPCMTTSPLTWCPKPAQSVSLIFVQHSSYIGTTLCGGRSPGCTLYPFVPKPCTFEVSWDVSLPDFRLYIEDSVSSSPYSD